MNCNDSQHIYTSAQVTDCTQIQPGIYSLTVSFAPDVPVTEQTILPGQFFMLRAEPSQVLLSRPISVYRTQTTGTTVSVTFLILQKGNGTIELCSSRPGDTVSLIGPLGNSFPAPQPDTVSCIIGGGIGIAPVAGFAETLPPRSYDFFACFRTGSYGLDFLQPANLTVTTDDGSRGIKGMLPDVLSVPVLADKKYSVVYACGPEPMLAYVQHICGEAGIPCFLSMETRMACGMGACLGCTVPTTEGNKRCCKEGPVFPGEILKFPAPAEAGIKTGTGTKNTAVKQTTAAKDVSRQPPEPPVAKPDLSVIIAGITFANPVIAASGTFGYGTEYASLFDVNRLGGICSKGLTLEPRSGNPGIRLQETAGGIINSIGLENPGIPHFISTELPRMLALEPVTIANLSGSTVDSYAEGARLLERTGVPMIELNISCPNVKAGGMAFGLEPEAAAAVTRAVKAAAPSKPLIVKLSPNAPDITAVAEAVREAGADALSLINTVQALAVDVERGTPVFANITAGLSGPAVKPLALRMVYDVVRRMNRLPESRRIPVIGLGGIRTWQDAAEFIMAGATAVQVGTATFTAPDCMVHIIDGLTAFMKRKGYRSLEEMRGIAQQ